MVVRKIDLQHTRNAEHVQFIDSACGILRKYNVDPENLGESYDELERRLKDEKIALAAEKANAKIAEKNEADAYRDSMHSSTFCYLKSIVYNRKDPRWEAAQRVMKSFKAAGNPTGLAENAESSMLAALCKRMEAHRNDLELTGANVHIDQLMEANREFIRLEAECREIISGLKNSDVSSVSKARKLTDPLYKSIIGVINGYAGLSHKKEACKGLVDEMNTLVAKYEALIDGRKGGDGSDTGNNDNKE